MRALCHSWLLANARATAECYCFVSISEIAATAQALQTTYMSLHAVPRSTRPVHVGAVDD
jgi:hypothetical protein